MIMDGTVEQDLDSAKLRSLAKQRLGVVLDEVGELEDMVGHGSIGAVYRATNSAGQPVAVKIMHEHIKTNENLRDRFMREATILDQVDHPNSIEVYGTGEAETGEKYFVMELLEGEEVAAIWSREGAFEVEKAFKIAAQTLDCLEAYHQAEVLHRDLKPSNLFVTHEGLVKLLDFGLARFRVEGLPKTRGGVTMGTPAYMAREQALGRQEKIDVRTDVFGIGAVLYELISGRTIHEIDSVEATLVQAATSRPDPLSTHAPDVPEAAAAIVDKAVNHDRADRYQSAGEMRDAIREFLGYETGEVAVGSGTSSDSGTVASESSGGERVGVEPTNPAEPPPVDEAVPTDGESLPSLDEDLDDLDEQAMDQALGSWDEEEIESWEEQSDGGDSEEVDETDSVDKDNPSILMEAQELESRIETGSYESAGSEVS
ncbi:MAG: serine/threonine protein kinase, partial [Bradymonadaceae bacterium]